MDAHAFEIDPQRREVRVGERRVRVSPRSFELLVYLTRHSDRVISVDELREAVWAGGRAGAIRQEVHILRTALARAGIAGVVESVRGIGYRARRPPAAIDPSAARAVAAASRFVAVGTEAALRRAAAWYRRAAVCDPNCSAAWIGLARTHVLLGVVGHDRPALAERCAMTAVMSAPPSAASRLARLDIALFLRGQIDAGLDDARCDAVMNEGARASHRAWTSLIAGDSAGALQQARSAVALDPASIDAHEDLGAIAYYAGAAGESVAELSLVVAMDPVRTQARSGLAMAQLTLGRAGDAVATIEHVPDADNGALAAHAVVASRAGDRSTARRLALRVLEGEQRYVAPYHAAKCWFALGRRTDFAAAMEDARATPHAPFLRHVHWAG